MSVLKESDAGSLHTEIEKLFKARGASHNFQLGVLAMAHALLEDGNEELKHQLLTGMIHVQASVVTRATTEVGHLSQGLKAVLEVSDEEIKAAGKEVDKMYAEMKGSEPEG